MDAYLLIYVYAVGWLQFFFWNFKVQDISILLSLAMYLKRKHIKINTNVLFLKCERFTLINDCTTSMFGGVSNFN